MRSDSRLAQSLCLRAGMLATASRFGAGLCDDRLGNDQLPGFHPRAVPGRFAQPRRASDAGSESRYRIFFRTVRGLERGRRRQRRPLRRDRSPRPRLSRGSHGCEFAALDRRPARSLRHRHRSKRRSIRRHLPRWQGLPHRYRQSHEQSQSYGVLRSQDALYLVAGNRPRWRALCGYRRSGQDLPRRLRGLGRVVLRYRAVARYRLGRGCARPPAGGHRAQWHSLSRIGQGQGLRAVRCQPARDPRHHSAAGWDRLRGRARRIAGQAYAGRESSRAVGRRPERGYRARGHPKPLLWKRRTYAARGRDQSLVRPNPIKQSPAALPRRR